ncbi:hypothetical protein QF047_002388 [Arthrobacter sp. W4I7]|nr:hypothetical protein [Arthrobacter sp. W4I7]
MAHNSEALRLVKRSAPEPAVGHRMITRIID